MTRLSLLTTARAVTAAVVAAGLLLSTSAVGAEPATPAPAGDATLLAAGSYWHGFVEFWTGSLKKQSGITLAILGVGAVCLFIITRGKWRK